MSLSGCTPSAPSPSASPSAAKPTPSESASAEPTPEVVHHAASLIITAQGVSVLDETDTIMVEIPYTSEGVAAATSIGDALGVAPVATAVAGGTCSRPGMTFDWGGFKLHSAGVITMGGDAAFSVSADSAVTAGVGVFGPHDLQVGATTAQLLAADPAMVNYDYGFGITMFGLDIRSGSGFDAVVTQGAVEGGTLQRMQSPVYILGDC